MTDLLDGLLSKDFAAFIGKTLETVDPGANYHDNWHIRLIAHQLEQVRQGRIRRLIINIPPRSLKSICVSVAWPAWLLGHAPHCRIIAASYAASLSVKHSLDTRLVMSSDWYRRIFPDTVLSRDQNQKHKFVTTARGHRIATSLGGGVLGEGGNFLIVDDPLNPVQAMNRRWRDYANSWFDHSFATRLDDKKKGAIVLVMQRLHDNDLSGYLLKRGGWTHLCLPAVAVQPENWDFRKREVGELLHPEREDIQVIERMRMELGSHAFAAQYQQMPLPEEGGIVKAAWFRRYAALPEQVERRVQSWDTAIKSGEEHDASVCLTFAEAKGCSYLIDAAVMRLEYPELKKAMLASAKQWEPQAILIEDKASGQQLLQDMRRETALPVIRVNPKNDKVTRFAAISAMIEAGKVFLPERARWLADFEREIMDFPNGNHDDQVDALSQYLDWLRGCAWERLRIRSI